MEHQEWPPKMRLLKIFPNPPLNQIIELRTGGVRVSFVFDPFFGFAIVSCGVIVEHYGLLVPNQRSEYQERCKRCKTDLSARQSKMKGLRRRDRELLLSCLATASSA